MTRTGAKKAAKARRFQRAKHVLWAGAIALACMVVGLFQPLDQVLWVAQSRVAQTQASGDIVFIGSEEDLTDPADPERRLRLARLVNRLDQAGVADLYVDLVFDQPTEARVDGALNRELREFGGEAFLVENAETSATGERRVQRSTALIARGVQPVGGDLFKNFLGYAWYGDRAVETEEGTLPNIAAQIADEARDADELFPISYYIALDSIPIMTVGEALSSGTDLSDLAGKTVLVGNLRPRPGAVFNIPGQTEVSPTLVHIFAAETLISDRVKLVGAAITFAVMLLALGATTFIRIKRVRRAGYMLLVATIPIALLVAAQLSTRMSVADAIVLLGVFAIFRFRASMAESLRFTDADTDLPTFAALENDRDVAEGMPAIVVARIHRFEDVRRSLPAELHGEYVLRIANRLKPANQDATIYLGQGHMVAWTMPEKDPALLREHLEGLRALFGAPLVVGDQQVDVGITFGVDIAPSGNVARRLANAAAVAERTTETYEPIAFADSVSEEDLMWDISLQARIDAALANGEIYLNYQPKVMVRTGEIVGVEVLVRWRDPVKGNIPPDNFIRQCETAGRMTQLTRHVLENACRAGNALEDMGSSMPIAVNVSATLVHETGIVDMVSQVLAETGFEPRRLTLELTETYRISDIERAADTLGRLATLGIKISMDDFGVGAASLEALLKLPFSELKIDRVFIAGLTSDPKAEGIVRSILSMGRDMRIIVVAEGVEDAGTLRFLRDMGCVVAQGYGISRPLDFDRLVEYQGLASQQRLMNIV